VEFKASQVFVQQLSAGLARGSTTLGRLRNRALGAPSLETPCGGTPKSSSTVQQLPVSVFLKPGARDRSASDTPTQCSCASFHMPHDGNDSPLAWLRSPVSYSEVISNCFGSVTDTNHCPEFSPYGVKEDTPKVSRSLSNVSMASAASQGPSHIVLLVAKTPTHHLQKATLDLDADTTISFGI
jgi:hypothetical protein